ncbi:MAG TPA: SIS domain-containing protein [Bacillota bacterium]|nr:SIS domain-containing protein [Bacillota bacterium]
MQAKQSFVTAREINQQPRLWKETFDIIAARKDEIGAFLERASAHGLPRVILTGAGSSAFVGDSVAPYLNRVSGFQFNSIATTDIVTNPKNYLHDVPTLMVSFARSGNSPESVATFQLANQLVGDIRHIVVTCNPDGLLAQQARQADNCLLLLMPPDSNDKGFAMTGSFTSMVLATLLIFNLDRLPALAKDVERICSLGKKMLGDQVLPQIVPEVSQRAVFLGSSALNGLAHEAALKVLELTAGRVATLPDSALGFRHGPKSFLNEQTTVFFFLSQDKYARQYEVDLIKEMAEEKEARLVAVMPERDPAAEALVEYSIVLADEGSFSDDVFLLFPYVILGQRLALLKSIELGIDPDNPSPTGKVNRVVKGVTCYPFQEG